MLRRSKEPLLRLFFGYGEKQVAAAFCNGEMERELRDLGRLDFFGLMKRDEDREKVMTEIDKLHAKSVYEHPSEDCSDACKERGEHLFPAINRCNFDVMENLTEKFRLLFCVTSELMQYLFVF